MKDTVPTTAMTFDPATNTYRVRHDWQSDIPISTTVIQAVAIVMNTPPTEFDPLFETIDPDILNQLLAPSRGTARPATSQVAFQFNDCEVQVDATGTIEITPDEDATPITTAVPDSLRDR